ncbi:hypothetical protein [Roseimaritima ulvae]|uniref:N-acetylneuraminate epimerase n=1 Tax=Roseimaritima ulvae TaxID=980254 RepID=A0A5B9QND0_9BACT|nr:hypothetical protein [Roseimaritima ulvae]QEG39160.1 N-acetylneuraminate epimerase precursor [Roseimaritima ulvae]
MNRRFFRYGCSFAVLFLALATQPAWAHFPWLITDELGRPILFFGEDLSDRTYHLPESLADFPVQPAGGKQPLEWEAINSEDFVGLRSTKPTAGDAMLCGSKTYGIYHGAKLVYYLQHLRGDDPAAWQSPPASLGLRAAIKPNDQGLEVAVFWQDQPLGETQVQLFDELGELQGTAKTNKAGVTTLPAGQLQTGLNAVMVGFTDPDSSGTLNDEAYTSAANYLTVTFQWPGEITVSASEYPDLPSELTSFGGTVAGDSLYIYGGHIGGAHSYSTAEQSNKFWQLDLSQGASAQWKSLASGPRLQGLAMVPYQESVIRLGGFTAKNAEGEEHDLHSQPTVSRYDAESNRWVDLTPLPESRSSFAAAVAGNHVYVVGGWKMAGDADSLWHGTAWSADLSQQPLQWKPLAKPNFKRRALSVAAHKGKIYAVGGMDEKDGPSVRTDVYDPANDSWAAGPSLVGESMTGFGCWAQSLGGQLYVSTVSGNIQRLNEDTQAWEVVGQYEPGRFFHCMLPLDAKSMLMVGGANMQVGRFTNLDVVTIPEGTVSP